VGAYALLGDVLTVVSRALPNVKVRLSEMISSEQFQALEKRDIDLALARPPVPEGLVSGLIHREDMVLAVPLGRGVALDPRSAAIMHVEGIAYLDRRSFVATFGNRLFKVNSLL
jgi:DNA-binding transcriptional LysR family regulator